MAPKQETQKWQLDKHIPLAFIATIMFQTAIIVWWASGIDNRVENLEEEIVAQDDISDRLARVETVINYMRGDLKRLVDSK